MHTAPVDMRSGGSRSIISASGQLAGLTGARATWGLAGVAVFASRGVSTAGCPIQYINSLDITVQLDCDSMCSVVLNTVHACQWPSQAQSVQV